MADVGCSFCGKSQAEVRRIFSGTDATICNECIAMCHDVMSVEGAAEGAGPGFTTLVEQPPAGAFLDSWAAGCFESLGMRIVFPGPLDAKQAGALVAVQRVYPELPLDQAGTSLLVVEVEDHDAVCRRLRGASTELEELDRSSGGVRVTVFRSPRGHEAVFMSRRQT